MRCEIERKRYQVRGACQGVGFRPFVFHLAKRLCLTGWVCNTNTGVLIEVQGALDKLNEFTRLLQEEKPNKALITEVIITSVKIKNETAFTINHTDSENQPNTIVLPDLAPCHQCLNEMMTKTNRRYRYPFINCTFCGPRFSIIEKLPYDRKNTTMKQFLMCTDCNNEYSDPHDRRFHAQPNACPICGPTLALLDADRKQICQKDDALMLACDLIDQGFIVALKGVGGFQLICSSSNEKSISNLRNRKKRQEKPFALMYPSIESIEDHCQLSDLEKKLLSSQESPIVLVKAKIKPSQNISPDNPYLGVMLPSSPLHYLLLNELKCPIIATSGNRLDEPICIDVNEAVKDLKGIADFFLVHNRPIANFVDDSIVKEVYQRQLVIRRARGLASIPICKKVKFPSSLAVGAHQKNTVAFSTCDAIYLSQHIGDLETEKACKNYSKEIDRLLSFYQIQPEIIVSDYHPDYTSTKQAYQFQKPVHRCQHHLAHVYSCMADNQLSPPAIGISWDGTGFGLDQTIWGGEFFLIKEDYSFERIAYFMPFPLPLSQKAIKEPRLSAIGMLYEIFGSSLFEKDELFPIQTLSDKEKHNLKKILASGFQTSKCSSVGRIFDAVCSLIGKRQTVTFEGQAAMDIEFLSENESTSLSYPFQIKPDYMIDLQPMLCQIIEDLQSGETKQLIAKKFHNTLAEIIIQVANRCGKKQVMLSGGVFQNKVLTEKSITVLKREGYQPIWHRDVPPNDGGIALGQLFSLTSLGK